MKYLVRLAALVIAALGLAGCGGGGSSGGGTVNTNQPPISGWTQQWSSDQLPAPSFTFPNDGSETGGVHYIVEPPPQGIAVGKTITMTFTITGSGVLAANDPSDVIPGTQDRTGHTISLYLNERGDNFSCNGAYADYRQFGGRQTFNFPGTTTITVPLQPQYWTGCFGQPSAQAFSQLVNNLYAIGFTLGGGSFAGHGLYTQSGGPITFTLNSFTVQ